MIGIGGIGMSALARYFLKTGKTVAGYDRTPSLITEKLQEEGIGITFSDEIEFSDDAFRDETKTLLIFTPAVKPDNAFMKWFSENEFTMMKRAEALGEISKSLKTSAVAGTHGKTSVSCMIAHILKNADAGCNAILGGIPKNYMTNFLFDEGAEILVTEADEFDKSFLKLHPHDAIITSADADHLDIYGNRDALIQSFNEFAGRIHPEGTLLVKHHAGIDTHGLQVKNIFSYALENDEVDVFAKNIRTNAGGMRFDLIFPSGKMEGIEMQPLGLVNIENAVAAAFMAMKAGATEMEVREGLKTFTGVHRRLDRQFVSPQTTYIDDYAHHPEEINALVKSVKALYPGRKITGIFQPHLYSRTRDFADGFAESLSRLDEIILMDIYPAREKPIEGITSKLIFEKLNHSHKTLLSKEKLIDFLQHKNPEILLTIGAGDIDRLVEPIRQMLENRFKTEETT